MIGFQRGINLIFSLFKEEENNVFSLLRFDFFLKINYYNKELKTMFKKEIKGVPRMHIRVPNANVVMYGVFETTISKDDLEKTAFCASPSSKSAATFLDGNPPSGLPSGVTTYLFLLFILILSNNSNSFLSDVKR